MESGDRVAFLVPRSELYMFNVLGIMSVGGVYVPLDDDLPDERLKLILEDSDCKVIIVSDETNNRANDLNDDSIILNISNILKDEIKSLEKLPVEYSQLACILYTSGTTGVPKGVKVTRRAIVNVVEWYVDNYGLDSSDVYGFFSAIGFDTSNFIISAVLYSGCGFSVIPEDIRFNMVEMNNYFIKHGVTHTFITTQVGKLFMESIDDTPLKLLLIGGEKLGDVVNPESFVLLDGYGPTESFAFMTAIDNRDKIDESSVGFLSYNMKAYVLDNEGRRVPSGAVGELYLSGYQLAEGYLNREEETKNAFIKNPFEDNPDYDTLYRTGDMVRVLPDGSLGLVGRRDGQVKIRGNRVELTEVESVIRNMDDVVDVTVQTVNNDGNNELVAYVVVSQNIAEDNVRDVICDYVADHKPDYMVPSYVVSLDALPLNVNGKVDKRALSKIELSSNIGEIVLPENETEKKLLDICKGLVNVKEFGVTTNLFNVGFSSLVFMKLNYQIFNEFGIELNINAIFDKPFVRDIADAIDSSSQVSLKSHPVREYYPLTSMQQVMLLFSQADLDSQGLVFNYNFSFTPDTDVDKLRDSILKVIDLRPSMKAKFVKLDDEIMQYRDDNLDVSHLVEIKEVGEITDELIKNTLTDFDLFNSNLFRFTIYKSPLEVKLVFNIHHLIMDIYSIKLFFDDVKAIYEGEDVAKEKITMYDVILNEVDYMNSDEYEVSKNFFEDLVKNYEEIKVPKNREDYTEEGLFESLFIDFDDLNILDFCNISNITPSTLFMAATLLILDKFTYSTNALVTNIYNGRHNALYFNTLGTLSKEVPVIVDRKDRSQSLKSFLNSVNDAWHDVLKHASYPFEKMFFDKKITSTLTYRYYEDFLPLFTDKDLIKDYEGGGNRDMELNFVKRGDGGFYVNLNYNMRVYTHNYMNTFLDSIKLIISKMLTCNLDETQIGDISLFDDERLNVISDYEIPNIVELFERQVTLNPSKSALIVNGEEISYAELNENANRIANSLVNEVDFKSSIVILLPRTKEMIYSILGVLKAGCSFILLDETYPEDRINYIISDCDSSVMITNLDFDNSVTPDELLDNENSENLNLNISSDDLAYMLYTSGTTGLPKGVMISHKNNTNITMPADDNICNRIYSENVDRLLSITSVIHSPAVFDYVTALASGLTIVFANGDETKNINDLIDLIDNYKPEIIGSITPSRLNQYLEVPAFVDAFQHIKKVVLLGEKFPPSLYSKIRDNHSSVRIYNFYGSSETVGISIKEIVSEDITIGRPIHHVEGYIMDIDEKVLPVDVKGQLYVSGPSTGLGYTKEEHNVAYVDINEKKFFKTGDLGSFLDNGEIKLFGRTDNQIKIRGQRLEPDEIITQINKFQGISDSTIMLHEINGLQNLIAYYVSDVEVNEDELTDHLENKLPKYMVPSKFIKLDEMPLTANGKIDKKALFVPKTITENVEPKTQTEKQVLKIYQKVIRNDDFGITDDIFALGFTSLKLMELNYQIFVELNKKIFINILSKYSTVEEISRYIDGIDEVEEYKQYPVQEYYPITNNQIFKYILPLMFNTNYDFTSFTRFDIDISAERFRELLIETIEMHPYFKTRFVTHEGQISQKRDDDLEIDEIEIVKKDEIIQDEFLNESIKLRKYEQLFGFKIFEVGDEIILNSAFSQALVDEFSINALFAELNKVIAGEKIDPELINGYDYSLRYCENHRAPNNNVAWEYYDNLLKDLKHQGILPPNKKVVLANNWDSEEIFLDKNKVEEFSKQHKITPQILLLASTIQTMNKFSYNPFTSISLSNINRQNDNMSIYARLTEWLYLISDDSDRNQSILDYINKINEIWHNSIKYIDYISEVELNDKYDLKRYFVYNYFDTNEANDNSINFTNYERKASIKENKKGNYNNFAKVSIQVVDSKDDLCVIMNYNKSLFTPDYIESFLKTFEHITNFMIDCDIENTMLKDIILSKNSQLDCDVMDIDGNSLPDGIIGEMYENNQKTGYYAVKNNGNVEKLTRIEDCCYGIRYDFEEIIQTIKDSESDIGDAIIKIESIHGKDMLCCYFTAQNEVNIKQLKLKLASILEKYKTPIFTQVDDLNDLTKPQFNTDMIKPNSDHELTVYECCCEVLGFDEFGITDDLSELGLTFFRKLKLNKLIYDRINISIEAKDILKSNTIQEIVEKIVDVEFKQMLSF